MDKAELWGETIVPDPEDDFFEQEERECHTCAGNGWVESLAEERMDFLAYPDKPGCCPNCGGTGLKRDCRYF